MATKQLPVDLREVQAAIYGVALSLDAFLVNGIPYGLLQQAVFPGFLQQTADHLMRDLAALEELGPQAPPASQPRNEELLTSLRATCQQLVELVMGLRSFRTLPSEQVRHAVSQILTLRQACVQLIQELEGCWGTPKPFYPSRPAHSTMTVKGFLTDLERLFVEEWSASQ